MEDGWCVDFWTENDATVCSGLPEMWLVAGLKAWGVGKLGFR